MGEEKAAGSTVDVRPIVPIVPLRVPLMPAAGVGLEKTAAVDPLWSELSGGPVLESPIRVMRVIKVMRGD